MDHFPSDDELVGADDDDVTVNDSQDVPRLAWSAARQADPVGDRDGPVTGPG